MAKIIKLLASDLDGTIIFNNQITTTDLKNSHGDIIHQAKLEQDCSLQYVVILDDKNNEKDAKCQIISIWYKNKQFYSLERETDAKRILFLEIATN